VGYAASGGTATGACPAIPAHELDSFISSDKILLMLRSDATAAYEPDLGVKKFVRELAYKPGDGFYISDEIETAKPAIVTSVLHADERVEADSSNRFVINASGVKLLIEPLEPREVRAVIESNTLTAPGPQGAVDKGERQERGQKLLLSTSKPGIAAQFLIRLRIVP
jgi:hypothetical protein